MGTLRNMQVQEQIYLLNIDRIKNKTNRQFMFKTIKTQLILSQNSQITNSSSQVKLIRRSSKSNPLKFERSQSKSLFDQSFPIFFKKSPKLLSKQNQQDQPTADVTPVKAISRRNDQQPLTQRKRQATPVKSLKQLTVAGRNQKNIEISQINIDLQMQISQLQRKLSTQMKIRSMYEQRSKDFQNEVSNVMRKLSNVEKQLLLSKEVQRELRLKVGELEEQLEARNNDLKNTKSSLEKLKLNIAQTRAQQYQMEVKKVAHQVQKLKAIYQQQLKQIHILRNQNTTLKTEITHVKNISDQNKLKAQEQSKSYLLKCQIHNLKTKLNASSTDKEMFLEQKIVQLHQQIDKLRKINQSKTIEIDFLARKNHQELEMIKKRKGQETKALRIKIASLMDQYKPLKNPKHNHKSKDKKDPLNSKKSAQTRHNRFACPTNSCISDEDFLCFSLSPQLN